MSIFFIISGKTGGEVKKKPTLKISLTCNKGEDISVYHTTSCGHTRMIHIEQTWSNLELLLTEAGWKTVLWNDLDLSAAVAKLRLAGYTASATLQSHTTSSCYLHISESPSCACHSDPCKTTPWTFMKKAVCFCCGWLCLWIGPCFMKIHVQTGRLFFSTACI